MNINKMKNQFLTVKEVSEILNLKEPKIRDLIKKSKLIAYRFGAEYRINKYDIEKFIKKSKV